MKHHIGVLVLVTTILLFFPCYKVYATDNQKQDTIYIKINNLPDDAVLIDLLIEIDSDQPSYTEKHEENLKQMYCNSDNLARYDSDGFVSMSAHYKSLFTNMTINKNNSNGVDGFVIFTPVAPVSIDDEADNSPKATTVLNADKRKLYNALINNFKNYKVILLDSDGNILSESEVFDISKKDNIKMEYIEYDASEKKASVKYCMIKSANKSEKPYINIIVVSLQIFIPTLIFLFLSISFLKKVISRKRK